MLAEQTRHRQRKSHRPPSGIYHAPMDPEQQTRLDMLICDRTLERVYAGEHVDISVIAQPGARGRLEAYLQPLCLATLLIEKVIRGKAVNLEAIRTLHPDAYALYSAKLDGMLRAQARERQQARFAQMDEVTPCGTL